MSDNQPTGTPNQPEAISAETWRQHIPADLKDKGYWKPVETADLGTVLKNYGHAQERLGKSIVIPEEGDAENWGKLHGKLGRPEKPDGYTYKLPTIDGVDWDKNALAELNTKAHEAGITDKQLGVIMDWYSNGLKKHVEGTLDKAHTKAAETEVKLKKEYAENYEANIAFAKRAARLYFGEEYVTDVFSHMDESTVKGLVKLGKQLAEDKAFGNNPPELQGVTSKEKAQEEINKVMSDRKHPYWGNEHDPATREAVKRMGQLHSIAFPE